MEIGTPKIKRKLFVHKGYCKHFWVGLLLIISIVVHWRWFSFSTLSNNDWQYISTGLISAWSDIQNIGVWKDINGVGKSDEQPYFAIIRYAYSLFSNFDKSYEIGLFFIYLLPIIVVPPIATFFLLKKIFQDDIYAFLGGIVLSFNTYFLVLQTAHLTIAIAYSILPLLLLFFVNIYQCNKNKIIVNSIVFSIIGSMAIILEPRIFYIEILFFLPGLFFLKKYFKTYTLIAFFIAFLNIFWILPLLNMNMNEIGEIVNRPLFGNQFRSLFHAITSMSPSWSWEEPTAFILQPIQFQFWILPIIAFSGLLFLRKQDKYIRGVILFIYVIALSGIFLSKQTHLPFSDAYLWLYNNFPGFKLYRESSKFFLLTTVSYSILIPFSIKTFIDFLRKKTIYAKQIKLLLVVLISIVYLLPSLTLVSGKIGTLFVARKLPEEYHKLNKLIEKDENYYRIIGVPITERWVSATSDHPKVSQINIKNTWYRTTKDEQINGVGQNAIMAILTKNYMPYIYNIINSRYFFVPLYDIQNGNNPFEAYGEKNNPNIRQWYIDQLDQLDYLEKIDIDTGDIVVYENKDYKPYIRTPDNLIWFENTKNLENKYSFIDGALQNDFDFTILDENKNIPTKRVVDFFEDVNFSYIKNSAIGNSMVKTEKDNLYINKGKKELVMEINDKEFKIKDVFREYLEVNGKVLIQVSIFNNTSQEDQTLYTAKLEDDKYYLKNGMSVFSVKNNIALNENSPVEVYKVQGKNIIDDGSFENRLWDEQVGDCHNYDDNAILGMKRASNASDGQYSLELQATRHIACTNKKDISVEPNTTYLLSFDYQSDNAKQAGFYLSFDNKQQEVISSKLPITDSEWRKHSRMITMPDNAQNLSLYIYSYSEDETKNIITRYDNFNLQKLELVKKIVPDEKSEFVKVDLPDIDNKQYNFEYRDTNYDYRNLIQNASLENGLWNKKVGDCHNYDDNPIIGMDLADNASEGNRSLELQATRHIACTSPHTISVNGGVDYLLEFDYQSDNANQAGFNLGFNDDERTSINEKINIKDNQWQTFTKRFTVPVNATTMNLHIYSYPKDEKENIITRYDDFKLIELPDLNNRYYLVSESEVKTAKPQSIEFDLINPTKKLVHIKRATKPFYLTMSESYHDKWQVQLNNKKVNGFFKSWVPFVHPDTIADEQHFKYMTFLNGWYVDTEKLCKSSNRETKNGCIKNSDGSYDIEIVIEFFPQRWFYLGLLISSITLISCLGYLAYDFRKNRRLKKSKLKTTEI